MNQEQRPNRYKYEDHNIIIEVFVKNTRQLFNERDPAPFRDRDLDPQFVIYLVSAVEEFSQRTTMKLRILTSDNDDLKAENKLTIEESIQAYFQYESTLAKLKLRKKLRTARGFAAVGLVTLIVCVTLAQFISSLQFSPAIAEVASVSFVILGWVALWHPMEALLYDWWPIREQRQYFDKIAKMDVEVTAANNHV